MKLKSLVILLLSTLAIYSGEGYAHAMESSTDQSPLPHTKYNYQPLAESIVAGCSSEYDKAKAIYEWLCRNIAYDTTYTIYHADECYEQRRGVCQAYCELYYHLARSVGIYSRIITGKSKDIDGSVSSSGHSWIYSVVDNKGIFLDATWGAGSLVDGKFERNDYIWMWFDINPKFLIFTHFPDDETEQFIYPALSYREFLSLPHATDDWVTYRLNIDHMFDRARSGNLRLPVFYSSQGIAPNLEIIDMPFERALRVGQRYTFRIKLKSDQFRLSLINNKYYTELDEWQYEGNGVYKIDYMVRDIHGVNLTFKQGDAENWRILLQYAVTAPTAEDWNNVAKSYPLSHPDVKRVGHLLVDEWRDAGVDDSSLAELIMHNNVSELPIIYTGYGKHQQIIAIPMHYKLCVGKTYRFSFKPRNDNKWAIIESHATGDTVWHSEFETSSDGTLTISITPTSVGKLAISTNISGNSYHHCIGYEIVE